MAFNKRYRSFVISFLLIVCSSGLVFSSTLFVGVEDKAKTMDPRFARDAMGQRISHHLLFSTLVQLGNDLQIVPVLAEKWDIEGDKSYIFYLKKNVRFHDGQPLTSADVKFTFEHLKNPDTKSPFKGVYANIEQIEALDKYSVKFTLKDVSASFLTDLIMPIVPKHIIENGSDFATRLIGSGPFKFISENPNEIVLEKNSDYFEGAPKVDKIVLKIVKDDNTRFLKMRKGELDLVINSIPLNKVDDFKKKPLDYTYRVIEEPGLNYDYISFNMKAPEFQNRKLRQAIAYGINVKEIIKYRLEGHAATSNSVLSPVNWYSEPAAKRYDFSPEKAKQLLKESGLKLPIKLEMKTSNNDETVGIVRIIQAQLKDIGIELELKSYEWGTFYGDIKKGNFQMTKMRWVGVTEPDMFYWIFHSSKFPPAGPNRGLYANTIIDDLTVRGRVTLDPNQRKTIYSTVQKIAAEELPYVSLWHRNNISIVHKRVAGYVQHPQGGFLSFKNISIIK
jgi:peptide/nickel transport system substrate-binding protein